MFCNQGILQRRLKGRRRAIAGPVCEVQRPEDRGIGGYDTYCV